MMSPFSVAALLSALFFGSVVSADEEGLLTSDMSTVSLLQETMRLSLDKEESASSSGKRDLVMAYVPYNFGHTVATFALANGMKWGDCGSRSASSDTCLGQRKSNITGCSLMYTPGKYWPKDAAQTYFGNKTIFGMLRDPYERVVSIFRGSGPMMDPTNFAKCDVNAFTKGLMRTYIDSAKAGKPYLYNCLMIPQAEFFDQPHGATVFVDTRLFPLSANKIFAAHGYTNMQIPPEKVAHVGGCPNVWAADLDSEAKALVRQVYARDFHLLCSQLGHCNTEESVCLHHVPGMCPPQLFKWDTAQHMFVRK